MADIYDYDNELVGEQLTPPVLRKTKFLAWLNVITSPVQKLWNTIFIDYKDGSDYPDYDAFTLYALGDRVIYTDKMIYEAIDASLGALPSDTTKWVLINDNFIGVKERIKYNSQIILLEYALNKWYRIPSTDPQIYIENTSNVSMQFVLGDSSATSSLMPNDSINQIQYMGNNPTYPLVEYDFIVWVPTAVYNTLGNDTANRYNNVYKFVSKYVLSGIKFRIGDYV